MFSPQQGHPTFAPPLFAHFVPAPGSQHPPGALIALPPRPAITHRPSQEQQAPQDGEDPPEAADNELLKKILLAVSKISHQVRHNEKALRDITSRQSAIEDRLSLMEQRVLRADTRVLEMFEQDKDIHDNLKKSLYEVGCVADEVRGLRMSSAKEEGGRHLSYQRGKRNTYPNTSLIKIEGVDDPKAAAFYHGKKVAFVYRGHREIRGSKIRVVWGKVTRSHGA
ncbi:MAG: hypothetical protein M1825_002809 [Sarcosagium campestre]|nr:MAG: hypothetical protein M1825_002809 [Sarcosagium campestre]